MSLSESEEWIPAVNQDSSIQELIKYIKHTFRECKFNEMQNILIDREEKMKMEIGNLTRDRDSLSKTQGLAVLKKLKLGDELHKSRRECEKLKETITRLTEEQRVSSERAKKVEERCDVVSKKSLKIAKEKDELIAELKEEINQLKNKNLESQRLVEVNEGKLKSAEMRVKDVYEKAARYQSSQQVRLAKMEAILAKFFDVKVEDLGKLSESSYAAANGESLDLPDVSEGVKDGAVNVVVNGDVKDMAIVSRPVHSNSNSTGSGGIGLQNEDCRNLVHSSRKEDGTNAVQKSPGTEPGHGRSHVESDCAADEGEEPLVSVNFDTNTANMTLDDDSDHEMEDVPQDPAKDLEIQEEIEETQHMAAPEKAGINVVDISPGSEARDLRKRHSSDVQDEEVRQSKRRHFQVHTLPEALNAVTELILTAQDMHKDALRAAEETEQVLLDRLKAREVEIVELKRQIEETSELRRRVAESDDLRKQLEASQKECQDLQESSANMRDAVRTTSEKRDALLRSQRTVLREYTERLLRTHAFGKFINICAFPLMVESRNKGLEAVKAKHPEVNLDDGNFGYAKLTEAKRDRVYMKAISEHPPFPLLEAICAEADQLKIITAEDLRSNMVDHAACFDKTTPRQPTQKKSAPANTSASANTRPTKGGEASSDPDTINCELHNKQINDLNNQCNKLEKENRGYLKEIIRLQAQVEDLTYLMDSKPTVLSCVNCSGTLNSEYTSSSKIITSECAHCLILRKHIEELEAETQKAEDLHFKLRCEHRSYELVLMKLGYPSFDQIDILVQHTSDKAQEYLDRYGPSSWEYAEQKELIARFQGLYDDNSEVVIPPPEVHADDIADAIFRFRVVPRAGTSNLSRPESSTAELRSARGRGSTRGASQASRGRQSGRARGHGNRAGSANPKDGGRAPSSDYGWSWWLGMRPIEERNVNRC